MKVEEATEEEAVEETTEMEEPSSETEQPPRRGRRGNRNRAVFHASDNSDPSCRVYVGNLAWEVTWRDLKDHMKTSGSEITRADVLANPDGRSKGCGIVEFATAEGAQLALLLNDTELLGRQIFVREDREDGSGGGYYTQQQPSGNAPATNAPGPSYSSGGGTNGGAATQGCRVYVGNLSWDVTWQDLKDHMRDAGDVKFAEVMTGNDGRSKGCGIVEFSTPDEAKEAITTLTDTELSGRMIFVREDREQTSEGGQGGRGPRPARGGGAPAAGGGGGNGCSLYVGNLAYETSWQDLKDHMRQAGNVDQVRSKNNPAFYAIHFAGKSSIFILLTGQCSRKRQWSLQRMRNRRIPKLS
jgi:RNA recognition motif-containing protein